LSDIKVTHYHQLVLARRKYRTHILRVITSGTPVPLRQTHQYLRIGTVLVLPLCLRSSSRPCVKCFLATQYFTQGRNRYQGRKENLKAILQILPARVSIFSADAKFRQAARVAAHSRRANNTLQCEAPQRDWLEKSNGLR